MLKAHRERKLLHPYSPLNRRRSPTEDDDDNHVQSLTGATTVDERPSIYKREREETNNPS